MTGHDESCRPRRSRPGQLSQTDRDLWRRVANTVAPSPKPKGRLLDSAAIEAMEQALRMEPAPGPAKSPARQRAKQEEQPPVSGRLGRRPPPAGQMPQDLVRLRQAARELHGIDRNELRKVRSGRVSIDARIDLHGMRQHEAHGELRRFLFRSHANGARWVIVITGKGARQRQNASDHAAGWQGSRWEEPASGVLREKVPQWLHDADLRSVVVGFTVAGPRHGGEGALYVRLRGRTAR